VRVLRAQLDSGRVHHACVFHGPQGVGKFTTAVAFAGELLGVPAGGDPLAHEDLHVVNKELALYADDASTRSRKLISIPIEVLRAALIEPAYRRPVRGQRKVFIVDEAELMNPTGQNAVLKTLEEPPAGTTIILVTSSEDRLLPTIRSRALRVPFVPLPPAVIAGWLDEQAGQLKPAERRLAVTLAGGSLGRAAMAVHYGLVEQAAGFEAALDQLARGKPAPTLGSDLAEAVGGFADAWVKAHDNASKDAANRLAAELCFGAVASLARHRLHAAAADAPAGDEPTAEAHVAPWLGVIDAVTASQGLLGRNVNLSLVCDHLASEAAEAFAA